MSTVHGPTLSLGAKRMTKSGDCRDWTVKECLEEALRQVCEEEIHPDKVIVASGCSPCDT